MSGTAGLQDLKAGNSTLTDMQRAIVDELGDVDIGLNNLEKAVLADDLGLFDHGKYGGSDGGTKIVTSHTPAQYNVGDQYPLGNGNYMTITKVSFNDDPSSPNYGQVIYDGSLATEGGGRKTVYSSERVTFTTTTVSDPSVPATKGQAASTTSGMFAVSQETDHLTKLSTVLAKADKVKGEIQTAINKQWMA